MSPVYRLMEKEAYMKFESIRAYIFQAICLSVKNHNQIKRAKDNLMQVLGYSEGLADYVADLLAVLARDYDHMALSEEFLREVAKKTWASSDTTGPKSFSRFLIRLGEIAPKLVMKELNALQNHLANDVSWPSPSIKPFVH